MPSACLAAGLSVVTEGEAAALQAHSLGSVCEKNRSSRQTPAGHSLGRRLYGALTVVSASKGNPGPGIPCWVARLTDHGPARKRSR